MLLSNPIGLYRLRLLATSLILFAFSFSSVPCQTANEPAPSSHPAEFAAVSIRLNKSASNGGGGATVTGYHATAITLSAVILYAYSQYPQNPWSANLLSGPPWLNQERYDIVAKLDVANQEEWAHLTLGERRQRVKPLLQKMLAERCGLVIHSSPAEGLIYGLFVASRDPKLKPSLPGEAIPEGLIAVPLSSLGKGAGTIVPFIQGEKPEERFFLTPMSSLAAFLSGYSDRLVQDRTKLTGEFDFTLPKIEEYATGSAPSDVAPLTIWDVSAIGLTLKPMKGMLEHWIVDQVHRPTEN